MPPGRPPSKGGCLWTLPEARTLLMGGVPASTKSLTRIDLVAARRPVSGRMPFRNIDCRLINIIPVFV